MKTVCLLVLLGAAAVCASADALPPQIAFGPLPDPEAVMVSAGAATTARFPDADTVLVDDLVREAYQPDGTSVAVDDEYTKILTEKGRRDAAMRSFFFMAAYGTVTVARAEIIKPDGRRVDIDPAQHGRVMIESGQMGANIYDPNMKLFQLSVPGLEVGDVCHFCALHTTWKAQVPDTWSDMNLFESDAPILHFTYEVSAPDSRPLQNIHLRAPITNTVAATVSPLPEHRTLYRWEVHNVPQMFPEPAMPGMETVVQRLLLSTVPDWPTLSRWYWTLCQPRLAAVSPEMRATVSNLVADATSRDARLERLFTFVSQNIRYMGITAETVAPGYEPHDVSMTFSNRYGVCRDKAALLVAMLRLAGFDAFPVLIKVGSKMDPESPLPWFNHAIVAVARPEGGYQLMDPTNEHTHDFFPAYLGNCSYLVAHPTGEELRVADIAPAEQQLVHVATRGTLDEAGTLTLDVSVAFDGINDTFYRGSFLNLKPDQRRRFFEGLLKARLPGAELTAFRLTPENLTDTTAPLAATLACRVRDYPVTGDGVTLLTLPWLGASLGYANRLLADMGLQQRRYPYVTELACGADETVTLVLGRSLGAPLQLPPDSHFRQDGLEFQMTTAVTNGTLTGRFRQLLLQPEYSPAEYAGVKAALRDIEYATRHRPIFATAPGAAQADVRILSDDLRIELTSPQAWTSTRTIVRQILTYGGKKRTSELKMPFNPTWQTAALVSATVSNLDGSVHAVTPREINAMDAPWVGGAARYPAGKLQVISLPGVETGSVIRTVVRRTQREAPFFSLEQQFGGFEPVASSTLEITAPRDLALRCDTRHGDRLHATCTTNGAVVVRRWEAGPLPAVKQEDDLPPWSAFQPVVLASAGDWTRVAHEWRQAFEAAMRSSPAIRERARALTRGCADAPARIRAIRDDVVRSIRADGPPFLELPMRTLTPADRTLTDGYGHDADRAILLTALLRAAGLEAAPLLVSDADRLLPELFDPARNTPQTELYNHVLVAVQADRQTFYLNDADQYAQLGSTPHDRHPFLALDGATGRVSVASQYRDRDRVEWTIQLETNGCATLAETNWFFGSACSGFRKHYDELPPEERRRHFQELVAGVSQSAAAVGDLVTDTQSYPGFRTFTVRAERYAVREGQTLTLLLPDAGAQALSLRADRRVNPLLISRPATREWVCRVILPAGVQSVPVLPPPLDWTLPSGLGHIRLDVQQIRTPDGRLEVILQRTDALEPALLSAETYPALIEINRRLTHPQMRTLLAAFDAAPALP